MKTFLNWGKWELEIVPVLSDDPGVYIYDGVELDLYIFFVFNLGTML